MGLGGVACPKPEKIARTKARKKRQAAKIVKQVRGAVVALSASHCERCGRWCGDDGHAHHRTPRSRGGDWTIENIEYLCWECHAEAHRENRL